MGKSKELNENLKQTILDLHLMPMMSVRKILITIYISSRYEQWTKIFKYEWGGEHP